MARVKRFKILRTAIRKYKAPVTAGTPFGTFDAFDKGNSELSPTQPARGTVRLWKGKPFGVNNTSDPYLLNRPSTRSLVTALGSSGFTLTDLAVSAYELTDEVDSSPNFVAARAVVKNLPAAGTDQTTTETSKITGLSYKRRKGETYTLPFCQDATAPGPNVADAMAYLSDKAADNNKGITFKPERFYGKGG